MDYDFTRDIYGGFCAEFSMGHEALGYWVTHELGNRPQVISQLLTAIEQLKARQRFDYLLEGSEYNLLLDREEAIVRAHALDSDFGDSELDEALDLYDQESSSRCGLDDFIEILLGWQQFISEQR